MQTRLPSGCRYHPSKFRMGRGGVSCTARYWRWRSRSSGAANSTGLWPSTSAGVLPTMRRQCSEVEVTRPAASISQYQSPMLSTMSRKRCSLSASARRASTCAVVSSTAAITVCTFPSMTTGARVF